jgi:hypothetical protein
LRLQEKEKVEQLDVEPAKRKSGRASQKPKRQKRNEPVDGNLEEEMAAALEDANQAEVAVVRTR